MRAFLIASTIALAASAAPPSRAQQPATPAAKAQATPPVRMPALLDIPGGDVHRPVVEKLQALMTESCTSCHAAGLTLDRDKPWGLSVVVADSSLRQQLKLGERGLVITAVAPGSQAARDGLKEKDILLASDDKPLSAVDDLKALVIEGEKSLRLKPGEPVHVIRAFALKLLRDGEPVEVKLHPGAEVHPPSPVFVGGLPESTGFVYYGPSQQEPGYWIGVSVNPPSETLRRHLKLGDKVGLVVDQVHKGTPAEKAGVKANDLLLAIGEKPLSALDDLVKAVNEAGDKAALSIKLLRGGEAKTVEVRPEKKVAINWAQPQGIYNLEVLRMVQPGDWVADVVPHLNLQQWDAFVLPNASRAPSHAATPNPIPNAPTGYWPVAQEPNDARLKALEARIGELTATIRELKEAVRDKGKDR